MPQRRLWRYGLTEMPQLSSPDSPFSAVVQAVRSHLESVQRHMYNRQFLLRRAQDVHDGKYGSLYNRIRCEALRIISKCHLLVFARSTTEIERYEKVYAEAVRMRSRLYRPLPSEARAQLVAAKELCKASLARSTTATRRMLEFTNNPTLPCAKDEWGVWEEQPQTDYFSD